MQGDHYGSQVRVVDLNAGYRFVALCEDGVQSCVTKPREGDTTMKTAEEEEPL